MCQARPKTLAREIEEKKETEPEAVVISPMNKTKLRRPSPRPSGDAPGPFARRRRNGLRQFACIINRDGDRLPSLIKGFCDRNRPVLDQAAIQSAD